MVELPPRSPWRVASPSPWPERMPVDGLVEPNAEAVPVRVSIVQDGYVTGWDEGALGFEENAVWFSGRASSFYVVASDVERWHGDGGLFALTDRLSFKLRHPNRNVVLALTILALEDRKEWEDEELVVREIQRLVERNGAQGQSQYPPLALRPGSSPIYRNDWGSMLVKSTFVRWWLSLHCGFSHAFSGRARERLLQALEEEGA